MGLRTDLEALVKAKNNYDCWESNVIVRLSPHSLLTIIKETSAVSNRFRINSAALPVCNRVNICTMKVCFFLLVVTVSHDCCLLLIEWIAVSISRPDSCTLEGPKSERGLKDVRDKPYKTVRDVLHLQGSQEACFSCQIPIQRRVK